MFPSHQIAPLFLKQNLTLSKILQKCNFQCINFNLCFIHHAKKQNKAYLSYHLHPSSILSHYPRLPQIQLLFSTFLPAIPFPGTKSKGRNVSISTFQTRSGVSFPPTVPEVSLHLFTSCCERLGTC